MVIGVVVVLLAGAVALGVQVFVKDSGAAKRVASTYLSAMSRGDFNTAYDQWCGADQALYPPAAFRAQHEDRQGEIGKLRGVAITSSTSGGTTALVTYQTVGDSPIQSLALRKVNGAWHVCPQGDRLQSDLSDCTCMTPTRHLEYDIAFVLNGQRGQYPLNAVQCPALSALVDGQPVVCRGTSRDGRAWDIQAVESNNATYTNVKIRPATS